MDSSVQWIVGQFVAGGLALIGHNRLVDSKIAKGDAELHQRVNAVRDEYVRRDDLKDFKEDVRATLRRIEEKMDKRA